MKAESLPNPTPPLRRRRRPLVISPSVLLISLTLALTILLLLHLHPHASPAFLHIPDSSSATDATTSILLYTASYSGIVTALNLTLHPDADATLRLVSSSTACAPNPSWLTLDADASVLYCTDEGLSADHGSVSALNVSNGGLALLGRVDTVIGPATLDPTGRFLLVPDLGADLIRIYLVDPSTLALTPLKPLIAAPGSGPRHVVFLETPAGDTYLYLATELANTITAYAVSYAGEEEIHFDRVFQCPTHGAGNDVPEGAAAAEIAISPDSRFLIVSSRNERSFLIPSPDADDHGSAADEIESDSLITYLISPETGELAFLQKFPAGGLIPRHFSLSADGTLAAVALQQDGRVVVLRRDLETGQFKELIASIKLEGEVTAVIFAQ
ncbi:hypothetical protein ACHAQA_005389 [Verticillium albo-atrum]